MHGLFDLIAVEAPLPFTIETIGQLQQLTIANKVPLVVGDILLLALVLYLWKLYPRLQRG